jgi:type IV pilus assembly protein PilA
MCVRWAQAVVMRKQKGFSLIELLIVVAIILIIAAIAIPNFLRAKISANEASAVQDVRNLNTAQVAYLTALPSVGYSASIPALGPPTSAGCSGLTPTSTSACLVDWVVSNATAAASAKSGYYFAINTVASGGLNTNYTIGAAPATVNSTGVRGFCSNEDAVVHWSTPSGAAPNTVSATCYGWLALQ